MENRRFHQWSELQAELLELILEKLDLADHARFSAVCSSWRSAAVENPPINKPLYFVLSHDPKNLVRRFITSFIPSWSNAQFIGAGLDGWLVILIDRKDLFLLNKGFNSIIPLPPSPESFLESPQHCKAVLSSPPPSSSSSSGECTVVIKHFYAGVFYCRLGSDKSFTNLSKIRRSLVEDIQFYKGRLYVLRSLPTITVTIFDHLLNEVTKLAAHFSDDPLRVFDYYRLLISENKLLIPVERSDQLWVFEFDQNESRVVPVENINENLLFLINDFCSLSITRKEHREFRRTSNNLYKFGFCSTFVLDTSEDSNKAMVDDPWPLFFVMFNKRGLIFRNVATRGLIFRNVAW